MAGTVLLGFWFTYFGPLSRGAYPDVSPLVHVHGWSFFVWYGLLIAQAGLIRSTRVATHRALGLASLGLAAVMVTVGLIVSTVRIATAVGPGGDPFWKFMGLPIFSIWVLFTVFYAGAIYRRRHPADHKRLMLLASAAALSAATFRIVVQALGFQPWIAIVGTLAPVLFVVAAMVHDSRTTRRIHRVYVWGAPAMVGLIGGMFLLGMIPGGEVVAHGVAAVGRLLRPFY
jgi:hypothetical protein